MDYTSRRRRTKNKTHVTTPPISVGKLCDNDLFVLFSRNKVTVVDSAGNTVMKGHRNNGLYHVPIYDTADKEHALPKVDCTIPIPIQKEKYGLEWELDWTRRLSSLYDVH